MPSFSSAGGKRELLSNVKNFNMKIEPDEIFNGKKKLILKFFLTKGSYATIAVRHAMLKFFDANSDINPILPTLC